MECVEEITLLMIVVINMLLKTFLATNDYVVMSLDEVLKKTKRERTLKKKAVSQSLTISDPKNFYHMCTVVDADLLPGSMRRVKLSKHSHDQSLGFYIRDGTKVCRAPQSSEREPAIFISRLIPGGLAEGTGLLAVNDEILEVNGIKVKSKSLDEVTDIIVANGLNLIITIAPASEPPTTPRLNTKNPVTKNSASLSGAKSTESLSKSCGVGVIKDKSTKKDGATQPHTGNESTKTKTQKEIISTI